MSINARPTSNNSSSDNSVNDNRNLRQYLKNAQKRPRRERDAVSFQNGFA